MKSPLTVSVIIPAFNASGQIRRALDSVFSQTYPATEVIVVDDGSTDDTVSTVEAYGKSVKLIRQPNGGASSARNAGIDRASGDLIAFLDADDYWEPHKLKRHIELYCRYPELGLSASNYFVQPPGGTREINLARGLEVDRVITVVGHRAFRFGLFVSTITVVVPRRMLAGERFALGLETAEDRDLWLRLAVAAPVAFISEPLATAVLEPGSLSRSNVNRDCSNMLRVVHAYRHLLRRREFRREEASVYGRWAGRLLSEGRARDALTPACQRLLRDPFAMRGWWALIKAVALSIKTEEKLSRCDVLEEPPTLNLKGASQ